MSQSLLRCHQLAIGYKSSLFENLSVEVQAGQVLAILGRNGIGKSTLLDTVVGLLPKRDGELSARYPLGYVPQHFVSDLAFDVIDVVLLGRASRVGLFRQPTPKDEAFALQMLSTLGVAHLAHRPFNALSGGQQQMVMIARALATGSDVLVLDEPMSALDLNAQQKVLRVIHTLATTQQRAVIFTTHDPMHAYMVADLALLLQEGGAFAVGRVHDVLTEAALTSAYGVRVELKEDALHRLMPYPCMTL